MYEVTSVFRNVRAPRNRARPRGALPPPPPFRMHIPYRALFACFVLSTALGAMAQPQGGVPPPPGGSGSHPSGADSLRAALGAADGAERVLLFLQLAAAFSQTDLDSCLVYAERAVAAAERLGEAEPLARALRGLGNAHATRDEEDAALDAYRRALGLADAARYPKERAGLLTNVATIYYRSEAYPEARRLAAEALALHRATGLLDGVAFDLAILAKINLSASRTGEGRWRAEAIRQASEARNRYLDLGNLANAVDAAVTLGEAFRDAGELERSAGALGEALAFAREAGSRFHEIIALRHLAETEARLGQPGAAVLHADRAVALAEGFGSPRLLMNALRSQTEVLALAGDHRAALAVFERYDAIEDSLEVKERAESLAAQRAAFETEEARRQVEVQTLRAERQRDLLAAVAVAALLLVLAVTALLRAARVKRRALALLRAERDETRRQRDLAETALDETHRLLDEKRVLVEEREVLLREVHHRVKNNLQVIASLLNLQLRALGRDPAPSTEAARGATASLRQMQWRVEAMALAHRQLYRDGDLRDVDAATYLGDLVRVLAQSGGAHPGEVTLEATDASVRLDADTAVPLGLIVAELVGNVYKHAFAASGSGHATVRFETQQAGRARLVVEDDGDGLPAEIDPSASLGMRLVHDLALQIGGTLAFSPSAAGGVRAALDFPLPSLSPA